MDNTIFAKIFNYPQEGQLLVTLDPHDETYEFTLVTFRTDSDDVTAQAKQNFPSEEIALRTFNAFSEPEARKKFEGLQKMLKR